MERSFKKYILAAAFFTAFLTQNIFSMAGSVPPGLPVVFGFGAMDNFATPWKNGQGTTCWDYSYTYLTQGWRGWNGDDPSYPIEHAKVFEPMGQYQVVTFYYVNNNPSQYTGAAFMTTYFNDLKLLFQKINQYTTKKVIVHIDPDLLGFWTGSNYTATTAGVVAVGSTGISDISGIENNIRGWNRAIVTLRNLYAPNKAILATHISGWCYGFDILNSNIDQAAMNTKVNAITNFISSIENGYPTDMFFIDPADRDADWRRMTNGDGNLYWTDPTHTYANARSFGKLGAMCDLLSTNLGRRGMMWQIPTGNTYFKTCNNTTGHYRDNYAQMFIPSTSQNGSSGTPGDAYSATVTAMGPAYWGQRGIIGILFGPGDTGCTHLFDNRGDGTTNPASDGGTGGPSFDVWGQAASASTDDDGGYIRLAVAGYCTKGKFSFYTPTSTITGTPPTPTRTPTSTPTQALCSTLRYDGETAATNLASGSFWVNQGTLAETAGAAYAGTYGMAARVSWSAGYWGGLSWNWAGYNVAKVFNAAPYTSISFYIRSTATTASTIGVTLGDTITASATIDIGAVNSTWKQVIIPLSSFTGINLSLLWSFNVNCGGSVSGDVSFYIDNFAFVNSCITPTFTITGTPPTKTRTPTATATLVVCYSTNYDGETGFTNFASGGGWAGPVGSTVTESTLYAHGGTHSMEFSLTWASGSWGGGGWNWAGFVSGTASDETTDLTQAVNLSFWVRTATGTVLSSAVGLMDNKGASASFNLPVITSTWQNILIPISNFSTIDLAHVWEFDLNIGGSVTGDYDVYIDDIVFVTKDCRTATPTGTSSRSATTAPTATYSRTVTSTPTRTATNSPSPTAVNTATMTATPSRTMTHTATFTSVVNTFTRTPTATFSRTATATLISTNTFTATASRTATASYTHTITATGTTSIFTFTNTPTRTATHTVTQTFTASGTPPATGSPTQSATRTYTRTATSTFTPASTFTGTATATRTATGTLTSTQTASRTHTGTATASVTQTFTGTVTATSSVTRSHTVSPTITETATGTPPTSTHTPTVTVSSTASSTRTSSPTSSRTPTGTYTEMPSATNTLTATPTRTQAATATRTVTAGASDTFTATASEIVTFTATPSATRTATVTMTSTQIIISATPTYTGTVSPTLTVTATRTATTLPSATFTPSSTRTPAATVTVTQVPSFTRTATSTITVSRTQTGTATPAATVTATPLITQSNRLTEIFAYPNPLTKNSPALNIGFTVTRPVVTMKIRIYTTAFRLIREIERNTAGSPFDNRMAVLIPQYVIGTLANGTYYYVIAVEDDLAKETRSAPKVMMVLK